MAVERIALAGGVRRGACDAKRTVVGRFPARGEDQGRVVRRSLDCCEACLDHNHHHPAASLNRTAWSATLHCLTGCAIGEVLGMVIGTALGLGRPGDDRAGRRARLPVRLRADAAAAAARRPGVPRARRTRAGGGHASIAVMEIVDNAIMLVVPGAMDAGLGSAAVLGQPRVLPRGRRRCRVPCQPLADRARPRPRGGTRASQMRTLSACLLALSAGCSDAPSPPPQADPADAAKVALGQVRGPLRRLPWRAARGAAELAAEALPNGRMPAPPHDEEGPHLAPPDAVLFGITKHGNEGLRTARLRKRHAGVRATSCPDVGDLGGAGPSSQATGRPGNCSKRARK